MSKSKQSNETLHLALIHPKAAGLDVGSMNMMVSYPGLSGLQTVKEYTAFTEDLKQMAQDLTQAGVTHVGMEATGVYWMAVYQILEESGFIVTLVNARNYRNVDGQKTDVKDCQWLQQLHAHGLLRASHIAEEQYRELRTYIHERAILQQQKSDTLNRIHKVLTQMNIKWQHVISDIEGVSGMKVIERIASGETSPETLLCGIKTKQLKASKQDLIKSLDGILKPFYITVLKNHLVSYNFYKEQMLEYEKLIEALLIKLIPPQGKTVAVEKKKYKGKKESVSF